MSHALAALVGALGITPLDFLLPLAMYITLRKPVLWKKTVAWILLIFYVIVMILGAVAAIRGIVLDASKRCFHRDSTFGCIIICNVAKLQVDVVCMIASMVAVPDGVECTSGQARMLGVAAVQGTELDATGARSCPCLCIF